MRTDPVGPEEQQDWLDALQLVKNSVDTLTRNHTHLSKLIDEKNALIEQMAGKLLEHENKIAELKTGADHTVENLNNFAANAGTNFFTNSEGKRLSDILDNMANELIQVRIEVAEMKRAEPEQYVIGTPFHPEQPPGFEKPREQHSPFHDGPGPQAAPAQASQHLRLN